MKNLIKKIFPLNRSLVSDDNYKFAEMIYNSIKLDFSMKDRISVSKQVEKEYSWDKTSLKILSLYKKIK